MNIDQVNEGIEKHRKRKRIGRGSGSGHGKTSGRGHNGHKSRSGYSRHPTFQGGDLPLARRIPKRGFHNKFALTVVGVNVGRLNEEFEAGAEVTPAILQEKGIVKLRFDELKILGDGEITKALKISANQFSATAVEKIKAAGGTATVVQARRTPDERVADLAKQSS